MKLPADKVSKQRAFYEGRAVCVTGGAGFIGGHLVDALMAVGANVCVIDDLSNSSLEHLSGLMELESDRLRFVHGSILDDDALRDAAAACKTIFHLGAIGSVPKSIEAPQRTWSVNATGTLRVLEAARAVKAERVVFASSSSVYGDQPSPDGAQPVAKVETMTPRPMSPYAASKLAGEMLLSVWAQTYALSTVSLRYFNVFGPRQSAESQYAAVVASFAKSLLQGEQPRVYGDGEQTRDMTFVSSAVLGTLLAGAAAAQLTGQAVNIGTGSRTSINQIAQKMGELVGLPHMRPRHEPARTGDVRHSQASIALAGSLLGYAPVASVEDGLAETVEWYKRAMASASG